MDSGDFNALEFPTGYAQLPGEVKWFAGRFGRVFRVIEFQIPTESLLIRLRVDKHIHCRPEARRQFFGWELDILSGIEQRVASRINPTNPNQPSVPQVECGQRFGFRLLNAPPHNEQRFVAMDVQRQNMKSQHKCASRQRDESRPLSDQRKQGGLIRQAGQIQAIGLPCRPSPARVELVNGFGFGPQCTDRQAQSAKPRSYPDSHNISSRPTHGR